MAVSEKVELKNYCESVYTELSDMRLRLQGIVKQIEMMKETEKKVVQSHISHLHELIHAVDWKLEIFTKVCLTDFSSHAGDIESTVSVSEPEGVSDSDPIPGGYIGG